MLPLLSSNLAPRHFIILLLYMVAVVLVWVFTSKKFAIFHYHYTYGRKRIIPTLRVFLLDYKRVILIMLLCALAFFVIYEVCSNWRSIAEVSENVLNSVHKCIITLMFVAAIFFGGLILSFFPGQIIEIIRKGFDHEFEYGTILGLDITGLFVVWVLYRCYEPGKECELYPYFAPYIHYVALGIGVLVLFMTLVQFVIEKIFDWKRSKKV